MELGPAVHDGRGVRRVLPWWLGLRPRWLRQRLFPVALPLFVEEDALRPENLDMRRALDPADRRRPGLLALLPLAVVGTAAVFMLAAGLITPVWRTRVTVLAVVVGVAGVYVLTHWLAWRVLPSTVHYQFARRSALWGSCPCCGYDLRAVPVEGDECTVCPECGSAWRVGRQESPVDGA